MGPYWFLFLVPAWLAITRLRPVSSVGCPALGLPRPVIVGTCHSVGMAVPAMTRWVHARMASQFDAFALMAEDNYWRAFIDRRPALLSAVIPNGISFRTLTDVDQATRQAYRREIGIPDSCRHPQLAAPPVDSADVPGVVG